MTAAARYIQVQLVRRSTEAALRRVRRAYVDAAYALGRIGDAAASPDAWISLLTNREQDVIWSNPHEALDGMLMGEHQDALSSKQSELDRLVEELDEDADDPLAVAERIETCRRGLALVSRKEDPTVWAMLLGNGLAQTHQGSRAGNLEEAIGCYHAALEVYIQETAPLQWAATWNVNIQVLASN